MKKPDQKLVKVTKRKKTLSDIGAKLHAAAAKAGGTLSVSKGLGEKPAPKQGTLPAPGMAQKIHPDIVEAGNELALAREKAKSATKFAKLKESVVITKMKAHGETRYVDRGQNIEITLKLSETIGLKQFDHNDESAEYE